MATAEGAASSLFSLLVVYFGWLMVLRVLVFWCSRRSQLTGVRTRGGSSAVGTAGVRSIASRDMLVAGPGETAGMIASHDNPRVEGVVGPIRLQIVWIVNAFEPSCTMSRSALFVIDIQAELAVDPETRIPHADRISPGPSSTGSGTRPARPRPSSCSNFVRSSTRTNPWSRAQPRGTSTLARATAATSR